MGTLLCSDSEQHGGTRDLVFEFLRCLEVCFFKHTIKVYVSSFLCGSETLWPITSQVTVSLLLCSSESNARGVVEEKGPWRALFCLKKPSKVRDREEGVAGRLHDFPCWGSSILYKRSTEKVWVSGQSWHSVCIFAHQTRQQGGRPTRRQEEQYKHSDFAFQNNLSLASRNAYAWLWNDF